MAFDFRQLEQYAGLSDDEIRAEMYRRRQELPKMYSRIFNNETVKCVICERGIYVNQGKSFYCNHCGFFVIFN